MRQAKRYTASLYSSNAALNSLFVTEYSYRGVPEKIRTTQKDVHFQGNLAKRTTLHQKVETYSNAGHTQYPKHSLERDLISFVSHAGEIFRDPPFWLQQHG
jgi:hypothetical protein